MKQLPLSVVVEIFLFAGQDARCRARSTCSTWREITNKYFACDAFQFRSYRLVALPNMEDFVIAAHTNWDMRVYHNMNSMFINEPHLEWIPRQLRVVYENTKFNVLSNTPMACRQVALTQPYSFREHFDGMFTGLDGGTVFEYIVAANAADLDRNEAWEKCIGMADSIPSGVVGGMCHDMRYSYLTREELQHLVHIYGRMSDPPRDMFHLFVECMDELTEDVLSASIMEMIAKYGADERPLLERLVQKSISKMDIPQLSQLCFAFLAH